jgi:hypothetical protein
MRRARLKDGRILFLTDLLDPTAMGEASATCSPMFAFIFSSLSFSFSQSSMLKKKNA